MFLATMRTQGCLSGTVQPSHCVDAYNLMISGAYALIIAFSLFEGYHWRMVNGPDELNAFILLGTVNVLLCFPDCSPHNFFTLILAS